MSTLSLLGSSRTGRRGPLCAAADAMGTTSGVGARRGRLGGAASAVVCEVDSVRTCLPGCCEVVVELEEGLEMLEEGFDEWVVTRDSLCVDCTDCEEVGRDGGCEPFEAGTTVVALISRYLRVLWSSGSTKLTRDV